MPPRRAMGRLSRKSRDDSVDSFVPLAIIATPSDARKSGNAFFKKGDFDMAMKIYTAGLQIREDGILFGNRSAARLRQGDANGALDDADRCVELLPDWPTGQFHRMRAFQALGQDAEAAEALAAFQTRKDVTGYQQMKVSPSMLAPGQQTKRHTDNKIVKKMVRFHEEALSPEELRRKMQNILKKMTVEKFPKLSKQLAAFSTQNTGHVEALINEFVEAASSQHHFINLYADLCSVLADHFGDRSIGNCNTNFKRLLLNACQASFEKHLTARVRSRTHKGQKSEAAESRCKVQMIGIIKFVGALLVRKMLASKVVFAIIEELLSDSRPEALESLAALLKVIGPSFDQPDCAHHRMVSSIFDKVEARAMDSNQSSRVRDALEEVLELRACGWQDGKPKALEDDESDPEGDEQDEEDEEENSDAEQEDRPPGKRNTSKMSPTSVDLKHSADGKFTPDLPNELPEPEATEPVLNQGSLQVSSARMESTCGSKKILTNKLRVWKPAAAPERDLTESDQEQGSNASSKIHCKLKAKIAEFVESNSIDEEAAAELKACTPEVQEMVLSRGDVTSAPNPSAAVVTRIKQSRKNWKSSSTVVEENRPEPESTTPDSNSCSEESSYEEGTQGATDLNRKLEDRVLDFIHANGVDDEAASSLQACPREVQELVLSRGGVTSQPNPSAAVVIRIKQSKKEWKHKRVTDSAEPDLAESEPVQPRLQDRIQAFIEANGVDDEAAAKLSQCSPEVQEMVLSGGDVTSSLNVSAAVVVRIKRSKKELKCKAAYAEAAASEPESEVEQGANGKPRLSSKLEKAIAQFIKANSIDGIAATKLRNSSLDVQSLVLAGGDVTNTSNASAAVIVRIKRSKKELKWREAVEEVADLGYSAVGWPKVDKGKLKTAIADFTEANELDEEAAVKLRNSMPEVQTLVLAGGEVTNTSNSSAAVIVRIKRAKRELKYKSLGLESHCDDEDEDEDDPEITKSDEEEDESDFEEDEDLQERVAEFIETNGVDYEAAQKLENLPPEMQELVLAAGDVTSSSNPSAAVVVRIKRAKQFFTNKTDEQLEESEAEQFATSTPQSKGTLKVRLRAFIEANCLDEDASAKLMNCSQQVQEMVLSRGNVTSSSNASAAVVVRIKRSKRALQGHGKRRRSSGAELESTKSDLELDSWEALYEYDSEFDTDNGSLAGKVLRFIEKNRIDEDAARYLRDAPPEVQELVLSRGDIISAHNTSATLKTRIHQARREARKGQPETSARWEADPPKAKQKKKTRNSNVEFGTFDKQVLEFIEANGLDEEAAADLKACPPEVQELVLEQGDVSFTPNPSATLTVRMKEAWRDKKRHSEPAVDDRHAYSDYESWFPEWTYGKEKRRPRQKKRKLVEKVAEFVRANGINEEVARKLKNCAPEVQEMVLAEGDATKAADPSEAVRVRIKTMKSWSREAKELKNKALEAQDNQDADTETGHLNKKPQVAESEGKMGKRSKGGQRDDNNKENGAWYSERQRDQWTQDNDAWYPEETNFKWVDDMISFNEHNSWHTKGANGIETKRRKGRRRLVDKVIAFLEENGIDEDASRRLKNCAPELQEMVLAEGEITATDNTSAVLMARIKNAKRYHSRNKPQSREFAGSEATWPSRTAEVDNGSWEWLNDDYPQGKDLWQCWDDDVAQDKVRSRSNKCRNHLDDMVLDFIDANSIDFEATRKLQSCSPEVQKFVISRGDVAGDLSPSATVVTRIKQARKELSSKAPKDPDYDRDYDRNIKWTSDRLESSCGDPEWTRQDVDQGSKRTNVDSFPQRKKLNGSLVERLEEFLENNGIDEEGAADIRACPTEVQELVLARGDVTYAQNPSATLTVRIHQAWRALKNRSKTPDMDSTVSSEPDPTKWKDSWQDW